MAGEKLTPIKKFLFNGASKKSLLYFGIVVLVGIISLFLIWHFSKMPEIKEVPLPEKEVKKEKTLEEIINELTTPQEKAKPLPEKTVQKLIVPEKGKKPKPLPDELIKNLISPR